MPTMKIRGGDLDFVECGFNFFPPGQNLKIPGNEKKKKSEGKNICFDHLQV